MDIDPETLARDIGTGFGTPDSLAALITGQRRKRTVLLRMLRNDVAKSGLPALTSTISDELLDYPNVGVWLVHCIRRLAHRTDDEVPLWADLGYLGWLAAAHAITTRQAGRHEVVVRDGAIMLPGLGLARLAPPGTHGHAVVTVTPGRVEITREGTRIELRDLGGEGDERWLPLRKLGATYSTLRTVYLDDLDPFRDLSDPYTKAQLTEPPPRLTAAQAAAWSRSFHGALEILRQQYEGYSTGIDEVLRSVVPLTAEPVTNGVSNTSLHAYGGVNMSAAGGPHQFALTLIHECQHAKLAALTDQVELQKPSVVKDLYAPWRDDPRPLSGLLQGIYAHLGVTDFWRVYRSSSAKAEVEFARWRTQVRQALLVAGASPLLTEAGTAFVEEMSASVARWSGETVPARLESMAREASAGHLVAWRVRNMTVDVTDLVERWRAGVAPGELPVSSVVAAPAVPARSRRPVGLVKMGISTGDVPESDRAYVEGDYERALALYTAEIGSPESWAGIALSLRHLTEEASVSALFRRPEVVVAVFTACPASDIVQLTAWLSS
ncbi:HEXXH motif domain-containing protein [Paractinoplanes abujensis]|uniref:HEXXH motif-containing protein n=1 Tax=Paractinoplanes abujensis TaxID=882441 RepID=A0A7W7FZN7_9ACTN|nr:HEXXH motif domain-containing protein [Actinoplanes abujensis]MBB4690280.1 HEXXH motif-containing protein [Actinoplanes abujensis]GID21043.1 HEXXH motif domain-containing protein [Actinoplanes abujensis]